MAGSHLNDARLGELTVILRYKNGDSHDFWLGLVLVSWAKEPKEDQIYGPVDQHGRPVPRGLHLHTCPMQP